MRNVSCVFGVSSNWGTSCGGVNYRILYFFHGPQVAILGHALTKEGAVPNAEIERTMQRKEVFMRNPARHSYQEEVANGED